jgi:hypothetical protein
MKAKYSIGSRIRGWFPQEPKLGNRRLNILSSTGSHSYRNFRILSKVAIVATAIPFLTLIWFSSINPLIRFAYQITIYSVVIVLSAIADRYAKRKHLQKGL